jgi:hypothetical protein
MSEPQFYAQLRGTIVRNGPRIVAIEVRVGADSNGGGGNPIHTVSELKDRTPDDIMSEINDAIAADSRHWPGIVRYQIAALSVDNEILGGRMLVEKRGRGKDSGDLASEPDEEPGAKGIVTQHMRFTESMFKTTLLNNQTMLEIMARALSDSNAEKTRLMGEHMRVMHLGEDLLDRAAERKLWLARETRTDDLKAKAFDAIFKFGPLVLGGMARGTRLEEPAKQMAQGSVFSQLAESLKKDPARFEKILACFSSEEKLGIMTGDFSLVTIAIERAGKVINGEGTEDDMAVAMRLRPLQELLTQEEKIILMQLVESTAKKKSSTSEPAPIPTTIEVKQIDPKVVPIDAKKKGA